MARQGIMYTICTKEEWRSKFFDPWFCEVTYGVFFNHNRAKIEAKKIDNDDGYVIIELPKDVICDSHNPY